MDLKKEVPFRGGNVLKITKIQGIFKMGPRASKITQNHENLVTQNQENPRKKKGRNQKKKLQTILKIKKTLLKRWHGGGTARGALDNYILLLLVINNLYVTYQKTPIIFQKKQYKGITTVYSKENESSYFKPQKICALVRVV